MPKTLPLTVLSYLEQLEQSLKQKSGVVPEDALDDARAHLVRHCQLLQERQPGIGPKEILDDLFKSFGNPAEVAEQYESASEPLVRELPGYAPDWRIYCTQCGRSVPAAKIGSVRIAARSLHKYTLGWCRGCRGLRVLRFQRDLQNANLTQQLGVDKTPEQIRHSARTTGKGIYLIVVVIVAMYVFAQLFFSIGWQ